MEVAAGTFWGARAGNWVSSRWACVPGAAALDGGTPGENTRPRVWAGAGLRSTHTDACLWVVEWSCLRSPSVVLRVGQTVDILTQGVYSAKMVAKPETGGDLVSAVWAFVMSGGLLSAGIVAGLSRASNPSVFFWASLPLAVQVLVPVASNWLGEPRVASGFRKDKARVHWPYFVLGTAMAAASLGLGAASLWTSPLVQAIYAVSASVGLCMASLWLLPRTIARAEVYMFLTVVMYLNVRGAMDDFYTGDEVCLPGGPHCSLPFYLSYTGMIGQVAGLGGIVLFQMFLSRTWFRRAFWTTTVLQVCAALIDITIVMRWNKRIGISDKAFYIVGDAMLEDVVRLEGDACARAPGDGERCEGGPQVGRVECLDGRAVGSGRTYGGRDAVPRLAVANSPLWRSHFVLVSPLRSTAQVAMLDFMPMIGTLQWLTVCPEGRAPERGDDRPRTTQKAGGWQSMGAGRHASHGERRACPPIAWTG